MTFLMLRFRLSLLLLVVSACIPKAFSSRVATSADHSSCLTELPPNFTAISDIRFSLSNGPEKLFELKLGLDKATLLKSASLPVDRVVKDVIGYLHYDGMWQRIEFADKKIVGSKLLSLSSKDPTLEMEIQLGSTPTLASFSINGHSSTALRELALTRYETFHLVDRDPRFTFEVSDYDATQRIISDWKTQLRELRKEMADLEAPTGSIKSEHDESIINESSFILSLIAMNSKSADPVRLLRNASNGDVEAMAQARYSRSGWIRVDLLMTAPKNLNLMHLPSHRKTRGAGSEMLRSLVRSARVEGNTLKGVKLTAVDEAVAFYQKLGFECGESNLCELSGNALEDFLNAHD